MAITFELYEALKSVGVDEEKAKTFHKNKPQTSKAQKEGDQRKGDKTKGDKPMRKGQGKGEIINLWGTFSEEERAEKARADGKEVVWLVKTFVNAEKQKETEKRGA